MKKLSMVAVLFAALIFSGCDKNDLTNADVNNLINGPNSIKGTISGTMMDNTAHSFPYDYHYTTNDGNSYSESWVEADGERVLYIWQYFYVDKAGPVLNGDQWSPSGRYMTLEFYVNMKTMQISTNFPGGFIQGVWQNITATGSRFVYGTDFSTNWGIVGATIDVTGLAYNKSSQMLTGKINAFLPLGNTQAWYGIGNDKATTITGDFKIFVPKENFDVNVPANSPTNSGNVYRKRG